MLVGGVSVWGQTWSWTGGAGDGLWSSGANWSTGTTPVSSNTNTIIEFANGGTYTVTAVPSFLARQFFVRNNTNVTLQANAASLRFKQMQLL